MSQHRWMQLGLLMAAGALAMVLQDVATRPVDIGLPNLATTRPASSGVPAATLPVPARPPWHRFGDPRASPVFALPATGKPGLACDGAGVSIHHPDLLGTLVAPGGNVALLRSDASQGGTWVSAGDTVAGWRVARIERDSVIIEADGSSLTLTLYRTKVPAAL